MHPALALLVALVVPGGTLVAAALWARKHIRPRYRHFKTGGLYEVLDDNVRSSEEDERCVLYRSLDTGTRWVRPFWMFYGDSIRQDFDGGRAVPRFALVNPFFWRRRDARNRAQAALE